MSKHTTPPPPPPPPFPRRWAVGGRVETKKKPPNGSQTSPRPSLAAGWSRGRRSYAAIAHTHTGPPSSPPRPQSQGLARPAASPQGRAGRATALGPPQDPRGGEGILGGPGEPSGLCRHLLPHTGTHTRAGRGGRAPYFSGWSSPGNIHSSP